MDNIFKKSYIYICLILMTIIYLLGPNPSRADLFAFNEKSVFCLYYGMSGKKIDEQDIEDLCFMMGRPIYSKYKPSELFVKNSQNKLRKSLLETISHYNEESVFRWTIECDFQVLMAKDNSKSIWFIEKRMPRATHFIMSKISKTGQRRLGKFIKDLNLKDRQESQGPVDIELYLKPESVEYRFEKRNIALEDVTLPLRYVVFQPIKVKLLFP